MKITKFFAGMAATAMALSTMAISASATKLSDVAYPSEENAEVNDAYYSIGAMGFYMSQEWAWNQGDWIGINDEGKIEINFSISQVLADKTLSGKGTLGDMGVMILNLPEGSFPYDIKISDAKFVATDGTETKLDTVNSITQATEDAEGGFRLHIRPTDEVDEETGDVLKTACPEVAGWETEGAFNGGVLSMTIDFNVDATGSDSGTSTGDDIAAGDDTAAGGDTTTGEDTTENNEETPADNDNNDTTDKNTATNNTTTGGTSAGNTTAGTSGETTGDGNVPNAETGAGTLAFAGVALAAAAIIVSKKK